MKQVVSSPQCTLTTLLSNTWALRATGTLHPLKPLPPFPAAVPSLVPEPHLAEARPSRPLSPIPQENNSWSVVSATTWFDPHAKSITSLPINASTILGCFTSWKFPWPRHPLDPLPNVIRIPLSVTQAAKRSPHAILATTTPPWPSRHLGTKQVDVEDRKPEEDSAVVIPGSCIVQLSSSFVSTCSQLKICKKKTIKKHYSHTKYN